MILKFQNAASRTNKKMSLRKNLFNSLLPDFAGKLCVLPYDPGQAENLFQQNMDSSSVRKEKSLWIMLGVLLKPSY